MFRFPRFRYSLNTLLGVTAALILFFAYRNTSLTIFSEPDHASDHVNGKVHSPERKPDVRRIAEARPSQGEEDRVVRLLKEAGATEASATEVWISTNWRRGPQGLVPVGRLPRLRKLNLHSPSLTDADLRALRDLTEIETLSIGGTAIKGTGLNYLEKSRSLKELQLEGNSIPEEALRRAAQFHALKKLTIGNVADNDLAHLKPLIRLEQLTLFGQLTDAALVHCSALPALRELYLANTKVAGHQLGQLARLSALETLILAYCPIDDESLVHLKRLRALKKLVLTQTGISDRAMPHLAQIPALEDLDIAYNPVTDAGFEALSALHDLRILDVSGTQLTDRGMPSIAKLSNLQFLDVGRTTLTDEGVRHLRSLSHLRMLDVSETHVTDATLMDLWNDLPELSIVSALGGVPAKKGEPLGIGPED